MVENGVAEESAEEKKPAQQALKRVLILPEAKLHDVVNKVATNAFLNSSFAFVYML